LVACWHLAIFGEPTWFGLAKRERVYLCPHH
jgi:hypothetical protein